MNQKFRVGDDQEVYRGATESNRAVKLYKSRGSELVACFVLRGGLHYI